MKVNFELDTVLSQLAASNPAAIEELYNYYYPRLYNFSKAFLKLEDGIDDILQDVFLRIWQNRDKIKTPSTFNSFIFTITRNLLLNELRSRLHNQKVKEKIGKLAIPTEYSLVEQREYDELKEKIEQAIEELPVRQKEIFTLSRIEGFSHREIAEKLHVSAKTIEFHIAKASAILRKKLLKFELSPILIFVQQFL